jgi:hypothetical protein
MPKETNPSFYSHFAYRQIYKNKNVIRTLLILIPYKKRGRDGRRDMGEKKEI